MCDNSNRETPMIFVNRPEAGKQLSLQMRRYKNNDPVILALPRGGVPVGFEVSKFFHAPLHVIVARKITSPHDSEFGIGALSEGNVYVLDKPTIKLLDIPNQDIILAIKKEQVELKRRIALYRHNTPLPVLKNKTVIVVDDGLATGVTAYAAILAIKKKRPKQIIFASPVCAYDTAQEFKRLVTEVICLTTPVDFKSVGKWYKYFEQTTDQEVIELLNRSKLRMHPVIGIHHAEPEPYHH